MNLYAFPNGYWLGLVAGLILSVSALVTWGDRSITESAQRRLKGLALFLPGILLLIVSGMGAWSHYTLRSSAPTYVVPSFILVLVIVAGLPLAGLTLVQIYKHRPVKAATLFTGLLMFATASVDALYWHQTATNSPSDDFPALLNGIGWILSVVSFLGTLAALGIRAYLRNYGTQMYNLGVEKGKKEFQASVRKDTLADLPH